MATFESPRSGRFEMLHHYCRSHVDTHHKGLAASLRKIQIQPYSAVQAFGASDGRADRYRLATYNTVVDVVAIDWSPELEDWCQANDWKLSEKFAGGTYAMVMHRTHVVVEVLVTDPSNDPLKGTPVPLDLDKHFVSEKA